MMGRTPETGFPALTDDLLARLDIAAPRYTSYPTAPEWSDRFGSADLVAALERAAVDATSPLSIYVHIPFCKEMCTYCGCNVIVAKNREKGDKYLGHVAVELGRAAEHLGRRRTVSRLHLGGGTPTFLDEKQLARLWRHVTDELVVREDAEIAIEIDPVVTSEGQLRLLRQLGFNRLSMGVQDFEPEVQQAVQRIQSFDLTRGMVETARALGYASVNLDLIYGLPRQTPDSWRRTLERVVAIRPDRVAVFSFAFVPSVKPHQRKLDAGAMPAPPTKLELFRLAHDVLCGAGYRAIGMDHFALPEDELSIAQEERRLWRDFQGYTVHRAADTVAFGVSGISNVGGAFAQNVKTLPRYEAALAAGALPVERGHRLTADDVRRRDVITQLMCNFWIDLGPDGPREFAAELERLSPLERDGLCVVKGGEITLTALGRVFVRNVVMNFDAYLWRRGAAERPTFSRTV